MLKPLYSHCDCKQTALSGLLTSQARCSKLRTSGYKVSVELRIVILGNKKFKIIANAGVTESKRKNQAYLNTRTCVSADHTGMWRDRQRELARHIGLEMQQLFPHQRQDMYARRLVAVELCFGHAVNMYCNCRHHVRHVHKKRIESRMERVRMRQKRVMKGLRAELLQGSRSDVMYALQVCMWVGPAPLP